MNLSNLKTAIHTAFASDTLRRRALFILGPSGVGKSQAVAQVAAELDVPMIDMRLAQYDPTDVRGVPEIRNDRTVWAVPATYPDAATQPRGILFLDEITSAPRDVQAVAYQIVLDRMIGEYSLPDGWLIVAAGNRASDKGVTHTMAAPLVARMTQVEVTVDAEQWRDHALDIGVRPEVVAFIKHRPDLLHSFDSKTTGPFPNPRSWVAVSDLLAASLPPAVRNEMIQGCVGAEAGMMFESLMRYFDAMPTYDTIVSDPDNARLPENTSVAYGIATGIIARAKREDAPALWTYIQRLSREVQAFVMPQLAKRVPKFDRTVAYADWQASNIDLAK